MITAFEREPPEVKGSLILGVMPEFNRDTLGFITRARKYGDIVRARFLYVTAYFLFDPAHIEYILSTNAKNFIKARSMRSTFFHRLVGNGLITSEGEFWKRQRRLVQPAFHRQRIAGYADVMVGYTRRAIASWKSGEHRDIHTDMMRLTLEIVAKTLFDADVSSETDNVGRVLSQIVEPFSHQATLKWILDNRLPTPGHARFNRLVHEIDEIVFRIIAERRATGEDRGDLLSTLLQAQDDEEGAPSGVAGQMNDQQLRDEVMTLFLAGHETSALSLSWIWRLLAAHPEAERKFHAEIDEALGGRPPSFADLAQLKYSEMVVKEALRLYPPAYGTGREALEDCEIGGYRIPAKSQIFAFQWVTHRDPRFFDEPDAFRPERWTEEFANRLPKYAYFPFGGGPRVCIGGSFAMMEIVLLMATIGQQFRFNLRPGYSDDIAPALSLRPRSGIPVTVHCRRGL
jgi:cytochrome P450